jgi:hypothetical protein
LVCKWHTKHAVEAVVYYQFLSVLLILTAPRGGVLDPTANKSFDREEIVRVHREATIRRMTEYGGTILAARDTTGVNYNTRLKTGGGGAFKGAV